VLRGVFSILRVSPGKYQDILVRGSLQTLGSVSSQIWLQSSSICELWKSPHWCIHLRNGYISFVGQVEVRHVNSYNYCWLRRAAVLSIVCVWLILV
jgi:hypothetical protein